MPTLIEFDSLSDTINICKDLKLSFIELNMNIPSYMPERLNSLLIKNIAKDEKIEFTLHMPDEIDLGHFNKAIRDGNILCCKEAIEWAYEAGVKLVNLHLSNGTHFTLPDKKLNIYEKYEDEFIENISDSFNKLSAYAKKANVKICIENCGNFNKTFINKALSKLIDLDEVGLTWDIGHDAKCGYKESSYLLKYEDKINHMHIHDYDGNSDHLELSKGNIDIKEKIEFARRKDISVVVEVKTLSALTQSIENLSRL